MEDLEFLAAQVVAAVGALGRCSRVVDPYAITVLAESLVTMAADIEDVLDETEEFDRDL